jgi:hypothetical protein
MKIISGPSSKMESRTVGDAVTKPNSQYNTATMAKV